MRSLLGATLLLFVLCASSVPLSAADKPAADLYVLLTASTQAQPCEPRTGDDRATDTKAIVDLVGARLPTFAVANKTGQKSGPDYLRPYLSADSAVHNVLLASYCKAADTYTISVLGYAINDLKIATSGTVSGTFDALENTLWTNVFGNSPPPPTLLKIANVAFLPVSGDATNVVNPRLLRNLPVTAISTPMPAPTATPAPGMPLIPTTRLEECHASPYHMLISGRVLLASASNDISRAVVAGAALKQSAPSPWGTYYTILGTGLSALYTPNSAEVGADVFLCPPAEPKNIYWLGAKDGHITGHSTAPALGVDVIKVQRAMDLAAEDLANQLFCVIRHVTTDVDGDSESWKNWVRDIRDAEMTKATSGNSLDPSPEFKTWCDGKNGYFSKLITPGPPVLVNRPIPAATPAPKN